MANEKSKFSKFLSNAKLKLALLWIWFLKNLKTFIMLAFVIYAIVVLTGHAQDDIFFGELSVAIDNATSATTFSDILMSLLMIILAGLSAFLSVWKKAKKLELSDIKSRKLKMAMVAAGLYFDSNGKLVKRVESILKTDINSDGKINGEDAKKVENPLNDLNIVKNTIDAVSELGIILTTKIEDQSDYEFVMNDELKETKEILEQTKITDEEHTDFVENILLEQISDEEKEEIGIKEEKQSFITKIANKFRSIFNFGAEIDSIIDELPETNEDDEFIEDEISIEEISEIESEPVSLEVIINEPEVEKINETIQIKEEVKEVIKTPVTPKVIQPQEVKKMSAVERIKNLYK